MTGDGVAGRRVTGDDVAVRVSEATRADLDEAEQVMRRVLTEDLGGYRPEWHADLDDLAGAYVDPPRSALFVARDQGRLIGTAAVRPCVLRTPPNPAWLARRYSKPATSQLVRVWIDPTARRRGAARALVQRAARWALDEGGYRTVYLHTDTSAPGAEAFWRSMPTIEVHDSRPDPFHCVHFELDLEKLGPGSTPA